MADDKELYDLLSMLDRLEEVREDLQALEERGLAIDDEGVDEELREEMVALGVRTIADVERRIAELNAQIDRQEEAEDDEDGDGR